MRFLMPVRRRSSTWTLFSLALVALLAALFNPPDNPLEGGIQIFLPSWAETSISERINIGAKNRKVARWKIKIPKSVPPGKYRIWAELMRNAFENVVRLKASGSIEVRS